MSNCNQIINKSIRNPIKLNKLTTMVISIEDQLKSGFPDVNNYVNHKKLIGNKRKSIDSDSKTDNSEIDDDHNINNIILNNDPVINLVDNEILIQGEGIVRINKINSRENSNNILHLPLTADHNSEISESEIKVQILNQQFESKVDIGDQENSCSNYNNSESAESDTKQQRNSKKCKKNNTMNRFNDCMISKVKNKLESFVNSIQSLSTNDKLLKQLMINQDVSKFFDHLVTEIAEKKVDFGAFYDFLLEIKHQLPLPQKQLFANHLSCINNILMVLDKLTNLHQNYNIRMATPTLTIVNNIQKWEWPQFEIKLLKPDFPNNLNSYAVVTRKPIPTNTCIPYYGESLKPSDVSLRFQSYHGNNKSDLALFTQIICTSSKREYLDINPFSQGNRLQPQEMNLVGFITHSSVDMANCEFIPSLRYVKTIKALEQGKQLLIHYDSIKEFKEKF